MQKRGYLGKYTGQVNFIKEDGIQSMIFFEGDDVPIHLSITERESRRNERITGDKKIVTYKMAELVSILKERIRQ